MLFINFYIQQYIRPKKSKKEYTDIHVEQSKDVSSITIPDLLKNSDINGNVVQFRKQRINSK